MHNPWLRLPRRSPYVLAEDRRQVEEFNTATANSRLRIDTSLLPEPYTGRRTAPIVILALNPGLGPTDAATHRRRVFRKRLLSCLRQEPMDHPFHHLDPAESGPGAVWWRRNVRGLLAEVGPKVLSKNLLCLEFFPYHSIGFRHARVRLPSQEYTFHLLRAAMRRRAVVILTRGERLWGSAVPELLTYSNLYHTNNRRVASISARNCPAGYRAALDALAGKQSAN